MQASTSRRKRRSSSILKVSGRSPSRNAFQDLNGRDPLDLQEGHVQGIPVKREVEPKSRRPSRRVSFADTYQVKEYLTDKDAASLGLWENSQTEDPAPQAAEGVSANAVEPTSSKPTISASGLDTLLNGPIKNPAAPHDTPVQADPEEHQPTAACDVSVAMDMTSALSCEEELEAQQTRTFDPEAENAAPLVDSKSFLARLMGGAGYHGNDTSPDLSLSCSSHAFNNTIIFGQDPNVTSSLDMTCMDESFAPQDDRSLPSDSSTTTVQQQDSKGTIDAGSFLSKFMQQRPSQPESRAVDCGDRTVVFGAADEQNDMELTVAVSTLHQGTGVEKERGTGVPVGVARPLLSSDRPVVHGIDEDTQFTFTPAHASCISREQAPLVSVTNLHRQEEDEKTCRVAEDMGFTVAVSSISAEQGNVPAQVFRTEETLQDKTTVFRNTDSDADMEFTTAISSITTEQGNSVTQQAFRSEESLRDKTTVFRNTDSDADMEFTTAISSITTEQGNNVTQQAFRTEEALQDKTTVFRNTDNGADMEFTTAISSITTEQGNNVSQQVFRTEDATQDKTTVFRNMDSGADMDFTTAISTISMEQGSVPTQLTVRTEDATQDKTTVFRNMDSGADMDFTTTINSIKTEQEIISKQPTVRTEEASQEKTIVFNNIESGADMEFTANIGSIRTEQETAPKQLYPTAEETNNNANTGEHRHPYHTGSVQPQNPTQQKTIVFSNIESAADMDFTTTIGSNEQPHNLVPQQRVSLPPQEAQQDKTTVFGDPETGADMEFTAALPSTRLDTDHVPSNVPPALDVQAVQQGPNNEGDMEFTACVSSLQAEVACGGESSVVDTVFTSPEKGPQCAGDSSDKTKIFGASSCNGDMEMTAVLAEQIAEDVRQPPEQVLTEETRVFSAEDAPGMELTCQFEVTENQQKPSRLNTLKRRLSEMAGETTQVFCGEDTARMDLTVGIGNVVEPQVSSGNNTLATGDRSRATTGSILDTQRLSKKQEETLDGDKTRVFGKENTARMDLTESVGGILASALSPGGNQTLVGGVFQHGSLKMSDCVGGVKEANLQKHGSYGGPEGLSEKIHSPTVTSGSTDVHKSTTEAPERTQVFSAEDGGMEMTQCQAGVPSAETSLLMSAKRRKMSEEGYGASAGASQASSTTTLNLPTMTAAAHTNTDRAGIVQSDVTASTEMTSCTGPIIGKNPLHVTRETPSRPLSSLTDLADFQTLGKPRSSLPLFQNRTSLMSTARRASAASGVAHTSEPAGYLQQEEKPEVVVTSPTVVETLEKMSTTLPVIGSEEHGVDTSQDGAEANIEVCHIENKSSAQLFSVTPVTADNRADQADDIGQEFDLHNEQPIELVETTAEFLTAVCQENLTLPASKPPVTSQYSAPLPSDLSHANSTLLDVTCRSNSSSDRSVFGSTVAEGQDDMTLPQQGNLSVSQFLTYCNINIQDQGKDRRSVMPFIKSDPPDSLAEHLEILTVLLPQAHVYEWSCNKLQERIGSTREVVKQQEERLDHNNPALFSQAQEMLQDCRLKEVDQLKRDMESLRSCCKKQAKTEWHEWTCKMTGTIVESLKEGEADIKAGVEELEGSLQTIDQTLASLDAVEKDLEDAIADLEGVQLPSDEDMQRYKDQQAALLQKKEELAAAQKEEEQLKSTYSSLQAERESLELRLDQLQLQQSEQGQQQEEDSTAAQALEEQVKALNRLQGLVEWDLEELAASQLRVTFLQKSLQLTVTYAQGDVLDKCRQVTDIHLESLLADEAACWAHLCHRMVLGAVDQAQLVQTYPTAQAQSKLLLRLSLLASEARDLGDEVRDIVFRRPFTTLEGTDLTVEFSSVKAHTKFFVTFNLTPGAYPSHKVKVACRHKIGALSPSTVEDVLSNVPPGRGYLTRMVQAVEELIKQHASVAPPV